MVALDASSAWSNNRNDRFLDNIRNDDKTKRRVRKKYKRKRVPETEKERKRLSYERQAQYEELMSNAEGEIPSIWSFESLFPSPVLDRDMVDRDLNEVKRRDAEISKAKASKPRSKLKTSAIGASSMMRVWREPKLSSFVLPYDAPEIALEDTKAFLDEEQMSEEEATANIFNPTFAPKSNETLTERLAAIANQKNTSGKVDLELTRMVEDRMYGYRRQSGTYETSLMADGAIKFREGVRLGNPLPVNAARLNYHAKKELRNNRVEEAQELYEEAIRIDPRDGRAYLGLSRCAQRRRDFKLARQLLMTGIANSVSCGQDGKPDSGANPFLLQALGCLEERAGHLSEAETLFIEAAKSRPSHAASWVALAQLRTIKFRQSATAGRVCYQAAERELAIAGQPPSSHVYTAWAAMEYKKAGDIRQARNLFKKALKADSRCSAAWLQLGVMEANNENWDEAELCFETVLKFDQRNTRVLQAYAIMESKRPDSNSRKVIGLFERALKINPRDGGVLQPYALYVAELGDIEGARDLLRRGTEVQKRHAPVWQAWGVLETRNGNPEEARNIFQQGIWACAQLGGGQSGGFKCARLWQAWGVLEAQEGDYAAARRCFNRALDADKRSIAAYTAWTLMEEELGNWNDARSIFERALTKFEPGTTEKKQIWRAYELMEQSASNGDGAQNVYQRSMRESFKLQEQQQAEAEDGADLMKASVVDESKEKKEKKSNEKEYEVVRWNQGSSMKGEIWMNDGSIEGKVPSSIMKKKRSQKANKS